MPLVQAEELIEFTRQIFEAVNTPAEQAKLLANRLVTAHLPGLSSHGLIRIKQYMDAINAGLLDPQAKPTAETETPLYANVNGNRAFGQVTATFAMELAIKKAKENGLSMVGCYNMNHAGRLGDYVEMAVGEELIAMAFCNGGGPNVAPFGAREKVLGANPVAFAAPRSSGKKVTMDFSTCVTAEGKLRIARNKAESIPEGLILYKYGKTMSSDVMKTMQSLILLGRLAKVEEMVGAAIFLASEESSFVTAQTIAVNGGAWAR